MDWTTVRGKLNKTGDFWRGSFRDMRSKCAFTVRLREGGTVTVYRTEEYNQPDISQVGLNIEQGERM
jgi:hypothetical protein